MTGYYHASATFGQGEANQTILTSTGGQDIFVAKYDSNGLLQWAKKITDAAGFGTGIAVDGSGNSYVTGYFLNSATFAPGEANETIMTAFGANDVFIAKYSPTGALVWVKQAGSQFTDRGQAIAVDASGNIFLTGSFGSVATFGPGEANETTLTASGLAEDVFVARYNSSGLLQWARRAGGTSTDNGFGIAVDSLGNSYVTGIFSLSATFGPGEANQTTLVAPVGGNQDVFVAKYGSNGSLAWAKRAGGLEHDRGLAVATDGAGNSYVTGSFRGNAVFAPAEANEITLSSSGEEDIFVAKYGPTGALVWVKQPRGALTDIGLGIAADTLGNSYVTGYIRAETTFGFGEANEITLPNTGIEEVFVAKYNSNGLLQWARRVDGTSNDRGLGIALDGAGSSYITGSFQLSATFGPGEPNQTILTTTGLEIFVAKFFGSGGCVYTLNPASASYDASGGGGTVAVSAAAGCAWTAVSNSAFLMVTGGAAGTGSGLVTYTVATNVGAANVANPARLGTLTIALQNFQVNQSGCTFGISPPGATFGSPGGSGAVAISTPAACAWTVTSLPAWAMTTSGGTGTGPGTWMYSVQPNATGVVRSQLVAVASVAGNFNLVQLTASLKTLLLGSRSSFSLSGATAADVNWTSIEVVAGRSYCGQLAPDRTAVTPASPTLTAWRANAVTSLATGTTQVCFVAPATETALFRVTQADAGPRSYRLLASETTLWSNWYFVGGSYSSYTLVRNTLTVPLHVTITWRSDAGVMVSTEAVTIPGGGTVFRDARGKTGSSATGSVEVAHDGPPSAAVGSQTTLTAATGLSFDTVMMQRIPL